MLRGKKEREFHCDLLSRARYAVTVAENDAKALEVLSTLKFDLPLTDHKMPIMDGLELIRKARLNGRNLPVVVVSSWTEIYHHPKNRWLTVSVLIPKSYDQSLLLTEVARVLGAAPFRDLFS